MFQKRYRKLFWDLMIVAAVAGFIYGTVEYVQYAGPWTALVMVPLMALLGYLAMEIIYPMWFGRR
jgi:hypothetical protein